MCLQVGLPVFGLLDFFAMEGRSVDSSSGLSLVSSGVFLSAPVRAVPRQGESRGVHWRGLPRMVEAILELFATGSPQCLENVGNAIGRPMLGLGSPSLGHRIAEFCASSLLMCWHLECAIGRPTPSKVTGPTRFFLKMPHLAQVSQSCTLSLFHPESMIETLLFFIRRLNPKMALLVCW